VSAKSQLNLDDLLEKILLVTDLELDPKANPNAEASGPIIESRLDVGRGPVATLLVHRGTLKVGDAIVAGDPHGRVKPPLNYTGAKLESAGPAAGVEIRPPASLRTLSRTTASRGSSRSAARSGSAASSSRPRVRPASRSSGCSSRCRRGRSPISTSSSAATSSARSKPSSRS
jgi:translation initiation factor IF-2